MKKKTFKLILAITLTAMIILSACSDSSNNSLSADAPSASIVASSTLDEMESITSGMESSDADSSSRDEEAEDVEEPKVVRIDADGGLRMRSGPGTDYDIIQIIPQNAYAEVTTGEKENPNWLYVSYGGDRGWISKEFVLYEADAALAAENNSTSWAKVYYNYLSTFESVTYTSTMYGGTYTVAGRMTGGEKTPCSAAEFRRFSEYNYPVLICWDGTPLDADGNMSGPAFTPNVYLVENENLTLIDYSNPKWQTFMLPDGYPEPKGSLVANFVFKPENGGGPQNIEKALAWIETQM